jgi:UPF0176 protein
VSGAGLSTIGAVNTSLPILNISTYKFVTLADPEALRAQLQGNAAANHLKGTILLAEEGINLFLAGPAEGVRAFVDYLRATPFLRLKVKVKREIIRMNHPSIRPEAGRAPSVAPAVLARWLAQGQDDEGRPVVTLDTRNAFEIDHGTFAGAIDWRITKFSEFPQAVLDHRDDLTGKTIVSFCTGGIRCEKAAIYLQDIGLDHVYQLEGGILKYFEETDGAPGWQGGCFVFDEREALGAQLTPLRADAATPPAR